MLSERNGEKGKIEDRKQNERNVDRGINELEQK
jgi:hypothetical protein